MHDEITRFLSKDGAINSQIQAISKYDKDSELRRNALRLVVATHWQNLILQNEEIEQFLKSNDYNKKV